VLLALVLGLLAVAFSQSQAHAASPVAVINTIAGDGTFGAGGNGGREIAAVTTQS
jgi:opacity protein-like surface antigen